MVPGAVRSQPARFCLVAMPACTEVSRRNRFRASLRIKARFCALSPLRVRLISSPSPHRAPNAPDFQSPSVYESPHFRNACMSPGGPPPTRPCRPPYLRRWRRQRFCWRPGVRLWLCSLTPKLSGYSFPRHGIGSFTAHNLFPWGLATGAPPSMRRIQSENRTCRSRER